MNHDQITSLASSGESETVEFKRTTGERREAARVLCSMLNHKGGQVLFGVESDGRVIGQQVSDHTIEELAQVLGEIDPPVFPNVERVPVGDGREVIVVSVSPGRGRPYMYRGRAFRRVGNTSPEMSSEEYNQMLLERLHGEQRWENEPATNWSVADLDEAEIIRTAEEAIRRGRLEDPGTRDATELLRGFGLVKNGTFLRAAVVLFGREDRLLPDYTQCLLRVARFKGTEKGEFIDNRRFVGHAFELLRQAEKFLLENMPIAGRFEPGSMARVDEPAFSPLAFREAVANAICHREYTSGGSSIGVAVYDDRLEVTSSGSLHFGITPQLLFEPHESRPWNPLIASVFFRRGIIETWGQGTLKMATWSEEAGLPKPEILEVPGAVVVRFRRKTPLKTTGKTIGKTIGKTLGKTLGKTPEAVLRLLTEEPALTVPELATRLKKSVLTIHRAIRTLRESGRLERIGPDKGGHWKVLE